MTKHVQDDIVDSDRQHDLLGDLVSPQRDATPPTAPQAVRGAFAKLKDRARSSWARQRPVWDKLAAWARAGRGHVEPSQPSSSGRR